MKRSFLLLVLAFMPLTMVAQSDNLVSTALKCLSINMDKVCPDLVYKPLTPLLVSPEAIIPKDIAGTEEDILLNSSYGKAYFFDNRYDRGFVHYMNQSWRRIIRYCASYDMIPVIIQERGIEFPHEGFMIIKSYSDRFFRQMFRRTIYHNEYYLEFGPEATVDDKEYVVIQIGKIYRRWFATNKSSRGCVHNFWSFIVEFDNNKANRIIYYYSKGYLGDNQPKREQVRVFML